MTDANRLVGGPADIRFSPAGARGDLLDVLARILAAEPDEDGNPDEETQDDVDALLDQVTPREPEDEATA